MIGALVVRKSHTVVFGKDHQPPSSLLSSGLYGRLRYPMYAGIVVMYVGFVVIAFSLIGLALLTAYFVIYDNRAAFEEKVLDRMFGDEYRAYKRNVPKWMPRLRWAHADLSRMLPSSHSCEQYC